MADTTTLPEQLTYLVIRFSASITDLPILVQRPKIFTALSLKQLLRVNIPPQYQSARLRLIYAGKVLADSVPLSSSLKQPPPPRPPPSSSSKGGGNSQSDDDLGGKGKGKQPTEEGEGNAFVVRGTSRTIPPEVHRYYIHCALGDALTAAELASEATLAENIEVSLRSQHGSVPSSPTCPRTSSSITGNDRGRRRSSATTAPTTQALGFDRLLSTGFTPAEVAALRSQFQANISFTHTPDTMPSPQQVRLLEDRWLDSSANDPSQSITGADGTEATDAGWGAGFAVEEGGLDDMLWGYVTGFFWPLGALVWGFREDGVWTRRRQVAVVMGVGINVIFGFMRWSA